MLKKSVTAVLKVVLMISAISIGFSMSVWAENSKISQNVTEMSDVSKQTSLHIRTIYVSTDGTPITKEKKVSAEIIVMDKTGGDTYEDNVIYDTIEETGTIKVRGNSTSVADKKPFNISFSTKQNVFGMGKAKKWSLLANAFDKSLIRNRLAMELATEMGLEYTSKSTFVDLYINNEYYGNYLLIESVEVGKDRVDIDTSNGSDILIEKEYEREEEGQSYLRTARYGIRFTIGDPEGLDAETNQYRETVRLLNRFETLLEDGDFKSLSSFVDMESFANFYIVNELFKNVDFSYSSTRFYVKDGRLYAGPLWDLDLSSGNASTKLYKTYYENGVSYTGLWCQGFQWFKKLMDIPDFYNMVSKRYQEVQPLISNIIYGSAGNSIKAITERYGDSFERNYAAKSLGGAGWSVSKADSADKISYAGEAGWKTYSECVEFLKQWLINRNDYLQEQFSKEHEVTKNNYANVFVQQSEDDIILNGNPNGTQSMIGSYSWDETYKWLTYATFKGQVGSEYKYLVLNYTGDISTLRLQFVANAGKENQEFSDIYWFHDMSYDRFFVSADEREMPLVETDAMLVIDLEKSGIDMGKFNSGVHMHIGTSGVPKGSVNITDARFVKSVIIEKDVEEQTTTPEPVTKITAEEFTTPKSNIKNIVEKPTVQLSQKAKPGKVKIKSATKQRDAKKAKVTVKRVKGAKGYQIKLCKNKKFKKKNTITKNTEKTKAIIKKLKKNRKYYVKVRAYTIVNGKKYYGKWSKTKRVRFSE